MWGYFEEKLVIPLCRHAGTAWIWTEAFETVRQSQSFFYLHKEFEDMTPLEMQRTLVSAYEVEQAFLRPRKRLVPLVRNTPGSASPIHCMSFLLDRFILTTHYNGTFNLWALSRDASSMPKCNRRRLECCCSLCVCRQVYSLSHFPIRGTQVCFCRSHSHLSQFCDAEFGYTLCPWTWNYNISSWP